jgi:predicted RNA-binding Zn-ribbon protein involved in translation (DUF1610 family)
MIADISKSYVQPDNSASIVCPECGFLKIINAASFRGKAHRLTVKCKCGFKFPVLLEFRKYYRKTIDLTGKLSLLNKKKSVGKVTIRDLSMGGVCFEASNTEELTVDAKGVLKFILDDRHQSEIMKRLKVKYISGNRIHCEFLRDEEYHREMGFYLRP